MNPTRRSLLALIAAVALLPGCFENNDSSKGGSRDDRPLADKNVPVGTWELLGTQTVSKEADQDSIKVTGKRRYTAIRFSVDKGQIHLSEILVTFANGETFSPDTKASFKAGEHTRDIDLPKAARDITAIRFQYKSTGKGDAKISVEGKVGALDGDKKKADANRL